MIEPRVSYGYQSEFDRQDEIVVYDEVDRFSGAGNQLDYALTQRLFAQRPRAKPETESTSVQTVLPSGDAVTQSGPRPEADPDRAVAA